MRRSREPIPTVRAKDNCFQWQEIHNVAKGKDGDYMGMTRIIAINSEAAQTIPLAVHSTGTNRQQLVFDLRLFGVKFANEFRLEKMREVNFSDVESGTVLNGAID